MSVMISPFLEEQVDELRECFSEVECTPVGDGSFIIKVVGLPVAEGWTARVADVWFQVPVQYPSARPDCFWTEASLLLTGGLIPQNTGSNAMPGNLNTPPLRWYSWHVSHWSANGDTLVTYAKVIQRRFADPR